MHVILKSWGSPLVPGYRDLERKHGKGQRVIFITVTIISDGGIGKSSRVLSRRDGRKVRVTAYLG